MKKTLIITSLLSLVAIAYSCSPKVKSTAGNTATPAQVAVSAEILQQGKEISTTSCGKCHKLHDPQDYTAERWSKILDRMIPKSKLNDEQGNILRQYYAANAKANS